MLNKIKALKSNTEFMKYFNNTSWLFFDKIFKMGIGFFIIIYLTRYLGPERFGLLSYSQSFVSIFMAFASLGLGSVVIRELVKYPEKRDILLGTAFYLTLFTSLLSIVLIFCFNSFIFEDDKSNILTLIIAFTIIFQNLNIIIDNYFQYKVLSKYVVYSSTMGFISSSILKFVLIYIEADLVYFAYALLLDSIIFIIRFYIYL